jgi:hypothetical protein
LLWKEKREELNKLPVYGHYMSFDKKENLFNDRRDTYIPSIERIWTGEWNLILVCYNYEHGSYPTDASYFIGFYDK